MKEPVPESAGDWEGVRVAASVTLLAPLPLNVKLGEAVAALREGCREEEDSAVRVGVEGTLAHRLAVGVREDMAVGEGSALWLPVLCPLAWPSWDSVELQVAALQQVAALLLQLPLQQSTLQPSLR